MEIPVDIKPDEEGYTGRECPDCEKYFKIKFGTGLPDATDCHCPYCNKVAPQDHFWTKEQIKYAESVAMNKITGDFLKSLKKLEMKPKRNQMFSIGIEVKGSPEPIKYYSEKELEEKITCNNCTLEYTIYGAFGFCPDCGIHNSKQILDTNLDLSIKFLDLASEAEQDVKQKLIENALEDAISAFDGFGREHCKNTNPKISFQNISVSKNKLIAEKGVDISSGLSADEWAFTETQFQKRHLLAHKLGIVDEEFVKRTNANPSLIGKKISITDEDVRNLILHLRVVAKNIFTGIRNS